MASVWRLSRRILANSRCYLSELGIVPAESFEFRLQVVEPMMEKPPQRLADLALIVTEHLAFSNLSGTCLRNNDSNVSAASRLASEHVAPTVEFGFFAAFFPDRLSRTVYLKHFRKPEKRYTPTQIDAFFCLFVFRDCRKMRRKILICKRYSDNGQ